MEKPSKLRQLLAERGPVQKTKLSPLQVTARKYAQLLFPKESYLSKLSREPLSILHKGHEQSLDFVQAVLGDRHPLTLEIASEPENYPNFVSAYHRLIEDTLRQWPIQEKGRTIDTQVTLVFALRYLAVVTRRYATVFRVVTCALQEDPNDVSNVFQSLEYEVDHQVKEIKLHSSLGYFSAKQRFFGDRPVFGFRPHNFPFDLLILHSDPETYIQELTQKGVFRFLQGCVNGDYYLPPEIRKGLLRLDYIMLHEDFVGGMNTPFHPSNNTHDRGSGICLPVGSYPWLTEGGFSYFFPGSDYLGISHEVRHVLDDLDFPMDDEFTVCELRSFCTEKDIALKQGWQEDFRMRRLVQELIPRHHEILLGHGWKKHGLVHSDAGFIRQTKDLLLKASLHPYGAFILEQTKKFLENYLTH